MLERNLGQRLPVRERRKGIKKYIYIYSFEKHNLSLLFLPQRSTVCSLTFQMAENSQDPEANPGLPFGRLGPKYLSHHALRHVSGELDQKWSSGGQCFGREGEVAAFGTSMPYIC